jgi:hypothetical protein
MSCRRAILGRSLLSIALLVAAAAATLGQSIEDKLSQQAVHLPAKAGAFDQLVDIAKWYKIRMGIERVDEDGQDASERPEIGFPSLDQHLTVDALIRVILKTVPGYEATVAHGVLLIGKPEIMESNKNFLNIRIPEYKATNVNVYGAEFNLRHAIDRALHPEKYAGPHHGYGGGYGYDPDSILAHTNIGINLSGGTVREIMSEIIRQSGAMWTVHLVPAKTKPGARYFAQDDWPTPGFQWHFVALDQPQKR